MKLCLVCNSHFGDDQEHCLKDNSKLVSINQDPLIGLVIQDRYKLESVIGKGTMGVVYKATQELIGREVAVKVLHSHLVADTESLKRFHQQAKAASRLNHPHIITLYDYGVIDGGQPYIVMDLLKGMSLAQLLDERGNLHLDETFPIFKQICEGLGDAHKHGVVHRDVKPDNIVLEEHDNRKNWVKVVDFGIAKLVQGSAETLTRITQTGTVCGSPTYMSPEQFQGKEVDHRSDIYSLGAVLFETITGRVPFSAVDLVGLMSQHVSEPPPKLADVRPDLDWPPALEKLVARALAKDPDLRPYSMEDFQEDLEAAQWDQDKVTRAVQSIEELPAMINQRSAREIESIHPDALGEVVSSQLAAKRKSPEDAGESPKEVRSLFPSAAQEATRALPRSRSKVPLHVRVIGIAQGLFPWLLTAALAGGLFWVVSNDAKVGQMYEEQVAPLVNSVTGGQPNDPQSLFDQGKLAKARAALEQKNAEQPLTGANFELLNKIYMRMAEQESAARHYRNAVALLQKIPSGSSQYDKARSLIKKYRRYK